MSFLFFALTHKGLDTIGFAEYAEPERLTIGHCMNSFDNSSERCIG